MNFIVSSCIFFAQCICMFPQLHIIVAGLSGPNSARMVYHRCLAYVLFCADAGFVFSFSSVHEQNITIQNMMRSRKKLTRFKNHLNHVFIAHHASRGSCIGIKNKNIHTSLLSKRVFMVRFTLTSLPRVYISGKLKAPT